VKSWKRSDDTWVWCARGKERAASRARQWAHPNRNKPSKVPRLAGTAYVHAPGRRGVATHPGAARLRLRRGLTRSAPLALVPPNKNEAHADSRAAAPSRFRGRCPALNRAFRGTRDRRDVWPALTPAENPCVALRARFHRAPSTSRDSEPGPTFCRRVRVEVGALDRRWGGWYGRFWRW
jgi:hypothetical protein